ncbi:MAG TPA: NAD(P)H-dependent glycerol-3-phosphate dehydrogenase [Rhodothermales bacterium]|nr:NAD(P)H-dependent glycerol-3-phosphate dehydrogenase [Rhodothermales bacterium]
MMHPRKIGIFGSGSWGTALAVGLVEKGHNVTLWARREEAAETMRQTHHNPDYLRDMFLPPDLAVTHDLTLAALNKEMWVIATPSQAIRALATTLKPYASKKLVVVSVAKGIENGTLLTTSQVLTSVLAPVVPHSHIGVLYGPSHAEEVVQGMPTTVVAAAGSLGTAQEIQRTFMSKKLRIYVNPDLLGVEISGSVKNVMAIAAGISDGVGYGDNTKAAILTRGMAEIRRLGLAMGARPETFSGLAGIGDLVVTCMSRHSRNRYVGEQIGKGRTLAEIEAQMNMVAEGVRTTQSVMELARKLHVEMPITEAVHSLLFEGKKPQEVVMHLMSRAAKNEMDWLG